jgi:NADH dehydrogenase FAD-containing subunit
MKRVVIVGGGFAGVSCARRPASNPDVHIRLIGKNKYQQFQPFHRRACCPISRGYSW